MTLLVAVSGSAQMNDEKILAKARELGKELAKKKFVVVTGATTGVSLEAVKGAKEAGGEAKGFSPAVNEKEHTERYNYPVKEFDSIEFTGQGVVGRNYPFIKACNAVVIVAGSVGTLNELTIALALDKPTFILQGTSGVADNAKKILEICGLKDKKIYYFKEPKKLAERLLEEMKESKE